MKWSGRVFDVVRKVKVKEIEVALADDGRTDFTVGEHAVDDVRRDIVAAFYFLLFVVFFYHASVVKILLLGSSGGVNGDLLGRP